MSHRLAPTPVHFLLILGAALGAAFPALAQTPVAIGEDVQVNTFTSSLQFFPSIGLDGDGGWVVTWWSDGSANGDTSGDSVQSQRYGADATAQGGNFLINELTSGDQKEPALVVREQGDFITVFTSQASPHDADTGILWRRFAAQSQTAESEIQINAFTPGVQVNPSLAELAAGDFVVVWTSDGSDNGDSSSTSIQGRLVAPDGTPLGDQFLINSSTEGLQFSPQLASLESGGFAVAWLSRESSGEPFRLRARVFNGTGSPLAADFPVSGNPPSDREFSPAIAADAAGRFTVFWRGPGVDYTEIQGRRFTPEGSPIGSRFQVSSYTGGSQGYPAAAMQSDGRFLVVWHSDGSAGSDTDGRSVQGQRFDPDGGRVGEQFQVNSYTTGTQGRPTVAADEAGDFVVAWESSGSQGSDTDSFSVQLRRFRVTGDVGDRVWEDVNRNGLQDAGEQGVQDVVVELLDGLGQLVQATTTDEDGVYLFKQLVPGEYFLSVTLPELYGGFTDQVSGADDSIDSDVNGDGETATFALAAGVSDLDRDAGLVGLFVGNRVWLDGNENGIQDGGEAGVESVEVTLIDDLGIEVAQTLTDAGGYYALEASRPGEHYLRFSAPDGYRFTVRDATGDDLDSDVSSDGRTTVFTLDTIDRSFDAGLVAVAPTEVGDRVWHDVDLNGVQDGGEPGVGDVIVELFTLGGDSRGQTVTAADGSYLFTDLEAGTYYLAFSEPAGFCFTSRDQGVDELDSDVNPVSRTTAPFVLAVGQSDSSRDAGLVPDASVGNRVWLDDGDGLQAGGEPGVAGVTVILHAASGAVVDSTTTDDSGHYSFAPGPGDYFLEVLLPADLAVAPRDQGVDDQIDSDLFAATGTSAVFHLAAGAVDASRDAGLEPAVIGDRVWSDDNGDGRQQPGERGIAGVTVRLLDEDDAEVASAVTGSDGTFGFLGIATGSYRIEVVALPDSVFSPPDVGGDDLLDSDVDPATGRSELFAYVAASASRGHDAGLRLLPFFADGFESGDLLAWSSAHP